MARYMRRQPQSDQHSQLRPPVVVGAGIVFRPIDTTLFAVRRRVRQPRYEVQSRLRPPVVVNAAAVEAFYGPQITYWTAVKSKQNTALNRRQPNSRLRPPIIPPLARPVDVTLAPQRRGRPLSHLGPPIVVFTAVELSGPEVHLVRIRPPRTHALLQPPAVVAQPVVETYYGPQVTLAPQPPRSTLSVLRPPVIPPVAEPVRTTLAPQRRGKPTSRLFPPTVINTDRYFGPAAHLAYSRRGNPISHLGPPTVVFTAVELSGPETSLAPSSRLGRTPHQHLQPPTVVFLAVELSGPEITLAYSRRGKPTSNLQPPTVVTPFQVYYGPAVHLTRIRPRPTVHRLGVFPPQAVVYAPLAVHLTYSLRGAPTSFLRGLPIGASDVYSGPSTWLAYSLRGKPRSLLRKPPFLLAPFAPITVSLARNKPQPTTTSLEPPTVVQDAALLFFGPSAHLAYSRRGRPLSELKPPAVVGAGRVFRPLLVWLTQPPTPQRATRSTLREPVVVRTAVEIYGPRVELAPSRFPAPRSVLNPPAVVGKAPFREILTHLTYSRRGKPVYRLLPPAIGLFAHRPAIVHLTYSRRGAPSPFLTPPTVVLQQPFRGLITHLTRNTVQPTVAVLGQPLVTREQPFRGLLTHLAYSRRGTPSSNLSPPAVVNPAEAFYGPLVWLTRITHPPVQWFLKPPTAVVTEVPGDVECDDSTPYDVSCDTDQTGGFAAATTTATGDTISGTDSGSGQSTAGTDRATGSAEAGDRRT